MNIFNGKLDIQASTLVEGASSQWDIDAVYTDALGNYYAMDAKVGDLIYQDMTFMNLGVSRYVVLEIYPETDYSVLKAKMEWALPADGNHEVTEPSVGIESMIGRPIGGSVFLPIASVQGISDSFIDYTQNIESWLNTRLSSNTRIYDAPYIGDIDGFNQVFIMVNDFIQETLHVSLNGLTMKNTVDYTVEFNTLTFFEAPPVDCNLVVDINKL